MTGAALATTADNPEQSAASHEAAEADEFEDDLPLPDDPDNFSEDDLVAELEAVLHDQEMQEPPQHSSARQDEAADDDLHALIADEEPALDTQETDLDSELEEDFPNFDEHELADAEAELDAILAQAEADEEVRNTTRQENSALSPDLDDDEEFLFQDNPEEDKAEGRYHTGKLIPDEELSDSFRDLDAKGAGHRQFGEVLEETDEEEQPSDESWAEEMLEELQDKEPAAIAAVPAATQPRAAVPRPLEVQPEPEREPEPLRVAPVAYDRLTYDPIAVEETDSSDGSLLRTLGWILLNAVLLIALLAQLAWFHYDKLARDDRLRPIYQTVCDWAGCTLPPLQDVSRIKSRNLVVRSHPTNSRALVIDVMMFNQASFAQPFPDLAFQFSDLNGKVVAQRVFAPREYLSGEARDLQLLPPETPIHISLEIIDPGESAVNYRLDFLPRTAQGA